MSFLDNRFIKIMQECHDLKMSGTLKIMTKGEHISLLGEIIFKQGDPFHAVFKTKQGYRSLVHLIAQEALGQNYKYIFINSDSNKDKVPILPNITVTFEHCLKIILDELRNMKELSSKRPPSQYELWINHQFLWDETPLTEKEFDLLLMMAPKIEVATLYERSCYLEHELTRLLMALRAKKAIRSVHRM